MRGPLRQELARSPQEPVYARIYSENTADQGLGSPAVQTLCEPAQLKRTWISHKNRLMREFTEKMTPPKSRGRLCARICRKNTEDQMEHTDPPLRLP